ncbi:MAG: universal stress protein [Acidobacteriota bacterium]|nr:universal stress protein [Acidobacteriota bacterium]
MMNFDEGLKTIVLAVDPESGSGGAMEYARKLAAAYGARVVLVYCDDPAEFATVEGVPGSVRSRLAAETRAELERMSAELVQQGIHSHSEVRQGAVVEMLAVAASQHNAGLILLGTHGRAGAGPLLVGSVAEELARKANCPVLAVASDWNAGEFRPVPGGPVLLAYQKDEAAESAMAAARSLAMKFDRSLYVLHARSAHEAMAFLNPCVTTLKELQLEEDKSLRVRCLVKDGNPADAVAEAIEQYQPSVLVVGVKRKSAGRGVHGTVFTLLAQSKVPVLCVPANTSNLRNKEELLAAAKR